MGCRNRRPFFYKTPGASRKVTAAAGGFFGMTYRLSHPGWALDNPPSTPIKPSYFLDKT